MWIQPVAGGEHSGEDHYQRPRGDRKPARTAAPNPESPSDQRRFNPVLFNRKVRLLLDQERRVVTVEVLDFQTGAVVESIPAADLELNDYQGILVDLAT